MRTNIVLDDELVEEAMRLAGVKTKKEAVNLALSQFVARHKQQALLELVGQDLIDPAYDVRKIRAEMARDSG